MSVRDILSEEGARTVAAIRESMKTSGVNATGSTSSEIGFESDDTRLIVYGPAHVFALETGRGPRKSATNTNLWERILIWMRARGIGTGLGVKEITNLAKFITFRINQRGTRLYNSPPPDVYGRSKPSGVISKPVDEAIDRITKRLADELLKNTIEQGQPF